MTATANNILPFIFNERTERNQIPKSVIYIQIEEGVTLIPDHTFHGCRALTRVDIPNTVTRIGNEAF
eukprot:CAMPEP_0198139864 /NCGR_PEP_ID=MMETSP1443-20131203/3101_1 /TAXON_ID=186043 /ORGANISM="Entomoneis sp., Strain CCMP2396" /LENGTH=66 /DNA_ID=CAMNT_0043802119 /DNA_START=19 /DNA_END=216 /DNA_ORIENTATION=+